MPVTVRRRELIAAIGGAAVLADRCARAAAGDAGDRVPPQRVARAERASRGGIPQRAE